MPISDIPILSMLRTRMEWHQERQRVLAENVANADTPNYQAKDLAPPNFGSTLSAASVASATGPSPVISPAAGGNGTQFATEAMAAYEVRPRGNAVTHEDEMMKVAAQPDGFRGGDVALHTQPRPDQNGARLQPNWRRREGIGARS